MGRGDPRGPVPAFHHDPVIHHSQVRERRPRIFGRRDARNLGPKRRVTLREEREGVHPAELGGTSMKICCQGKTELGGREKARGVTLLQHNGASDVVVVGSE